MKNFKKREEDFKEFEKWNLNNFKTRFRYYKEIYDNEKINKI